MTGRERLQYLAGVWAKWIGPWDDRDRYHELGKATFEALAHGDELVTLRSRLAAVEAERDAARAASEKDREWVGRALEKQAEYLGQSQMLVAERDAARAEVERLREDAGKLRVLLATSNANCAFCGLPAAEMAKCASGFPGCSRADDMILCVHPTRQDLLDEVERLREDAARNRWCEEMKADVCYLGACGEWTVEWEVSRTQFAHKINRDRNAAIDAARGKV